MAQGDRAHVVLDRLNARLSRRQVLVGTAAASATGLVFRGRAAQAAGRSVRPNVLCFISEDCGAQHLGLWGGPAYTPNIDALARDGVVFANAFSTAPVCAPSRTAMISGVPAESCAPAEHMRESGHLPAVMHDIGWPALLRASGYYCTNNAKTDYNAPIDVDKTWDACSPSAHWENRPSGAPFYAIFNPQITHELMIATASVVDGIIDGTVSGPYIPSDLLDAYEGQVTVGGPTSTADVRIPRFVQDSPTTRDDAAHYMNCIHLMDQSLGKHLADLEEAGVADDTIVLYYSDHGGVLPRSKRFCYDEGLHIPLVARFGKNVAHLAPGPPGSVVESPVSTGVDLPATILTLTGVKQNPMLPGVAFAGRRRRTQKYAFSARNRMDQRYDMVRTARDTRYRYIRNYMPHVIWGQHVAFMWLQAGYREWHSLHLQGKLDAVQDRFWQEKPAEELYDLHDDRDEVVNLASDPEHADVVRRMSAALDHHMLAIHDNGFIPEGSSLEGWNASRHPGAYPLAQVMEFAAGAIRREPSFLPAAIDHLKDPNLVMRFWATQACSMLGTKATPAHKPLTSVMLDDPSPHVRVAAAEALARIDASSAPAAKPLLGLVDPQDLLAGTDAELAAAVAAATAGTVPPPADSPLGVLGDHLIGHQVYWVRLYAANALENIDEAAFPALPQLLEACVGPNGSPGEPYVAEACRYTLLKLLGVDADLPDPNAVI